MSPTLSPDLHVDGAANDARILDDAATAVVMQHPARRKPLRMDTQDGPWSVSVAENPHDTKTYSIYIQTPTHHLTLTRTASEVADLHVRVTDAFPSVDIPPLPLCDVPTTKRRSSFLHTLSRLANTSTRQQPPPTSRSSSSQTLPTPAVSPTKESDDPFANPLSPLSANPLSSPSATATSLASYLTVISNHPSVRTSRPWRRFVRVRTDDLESVRVERAIKRVRSDLAMHLPAPAAVAALSDSHVPSDVESTAGDELPTDSPALDRDSGVGGLQKQEIKEEDEDEEMLTMREDAKIAELVAGGDTPTVQAPSVHDTTVPEVPEEPPDALPTPAPSPPTPTSAAPLPPSTPPAHPATRIPRSVSADPDKASRLSRVWTPDGEDSSGTPKRKPKHVSPKPKSRPTRKVVVDDFEMMRVLGKGCAGKVLLVRHRASSNLYALKAITKRHVLAHQELQHTLTEQAVLKRMAHEAKDPFVVKLWWSFHDKENLFLVMDFHPGGDLATQLARWGRLGRDRARFYAAEIVEGVDGLHAAGVIYRDLKPENILIGSDGHIVLTDFGLSKEFPRRSATGLPLSTTSSTPKSGHASAQDGFYSSTPGTPTPSPPHWMHHGADSPGGSPSSTWGNAGGSKDVTSTFCGTAEYLAPEVIQGLPYSYEVDWWSFGTMLYEMLTGITPFWANNHSDMYVRVLQDELQFPDDKAMDQDTKSLIRGLLQRNPALRMSEPRIKRHPYFSMIDWSHVYYKRYIPPYIPPIDPSNASDTQNFDEAFLDMDPTIDNEPEPEQPQTEDSERGDRSERDESDNNTPSRSPAPGVGGSSGVGGVAAAAVVEEDADVFDGYSFKGRYSVILDDAEEEGEGEEEEEEGEVAVEEEDDGYEGHAEDEDEDEVETPAEAEEEPAGTEKDAEAGIVVVLGGDEAATAAPEIVKDVGAEVAVQAVVGSDEPVEEPVKPADPTEPTEPTPPISAALPKPTPPLSAEPSEPTPSLPAVLPRPQPPLSAAPPKLAPPLSAAAPKPQLPSTAPAKTALKSSDSKPGKAVTIAHTPRPPPRRREKSGVPALDGDEDGDGEDEDGGTVTERDEDDWDFVETPGGEDRNGAKGTSLFARGVVDRYRLAVFRKASSSGGSHQHQGPGGHQHVSQSRSFSGVSISADSDVDGVNASPSASEKQRRRGRTSGLSIGKSTRQFLRARSPPSSSGGAAAVAGVRTFSAGGLLTPSSSAQPAALSPHSPGGSTVLSPHSLRSKDSTTSMGSPSGSSEGDRRSLSQSQDLMGSPACGESAATENGGKQISGVGKQTAENGKRSSRPSRTSSGGDEPVHKLKKMKKYKEGAEKVLSLFGSPRQERTHPPPPPSSSQAQS